MSSTQNFVPIYIGFDSRETAAFHVLNQSIIQNSSVPVAIIPVALHHLKDIFWRETHPLQSTQFSFSRFLVPYLSGFDGWSIFMDCDMIVRRDIKELWELRDDKYAVMCCQHDYTPKEKQSSYKRHRPNMKKRIGPV